MRRPGLLGTRARPRVSLDSFWGEQWFSIAWSAFAICIVAVNAVYTKWFFPKRLEAIKERSYEEFQAYCKGRMDQVLSFEQDRREAFEEWRDKEMELFHAHVAAVHGDDPDSRPANQEEMDEMIHTGHIPENVRGGISMMGPDGRARQAQGLFQSDDVGEATAFWLLSGSAEAWTRLSIAVAAAQAMQAAE